MLPQHLAGIVMENVIIHNILYEFYVYFISFVSSIYFISFMFYVILYYTLFHFNQQMLLLFILLVLDGNQLLFISFV